MDDVDRLIHETPPQDERPPQVDVPMRREAVDAYTQGLQFGDQVVLPRDEVDDGISELVAVARSGVLDEQPFGATRSQTLDQPQHLDGSAGMRSR
jgi:hypothetical protein